MMADSISNTGLLPPGFVDMMPEQAEKEARSIADLMQLFTGMGYQRIKPPMLEFESSLLSKGPGAALSEETFRIMDPVSHQMLGVRADITPQIARIVNSRFYDKAKPIRLTYANDVLRSKAGQLRTARQFCQVGCEIIHDKGAQTYVELTTLAALGLNRLGLEKITIDYTAPRLLDDIFEAHDISAGQQDAIKTALMKRDEDALAGIDHPVCKDLLALLKISGRADQFLEQCFDIALPERTVSHLRTFKTVYDTLCQNFDDLGLAGVAITFDPFEQKGFDYHHDLAFTLFSEEVKGELGRGGHYDVQFGSFHENSSDMKDAIGFTLYMDTVLSALQGGYMPQYIALEQGEKWSVALNLMKKGYTVMRIGDINSVPDYCKFVYKDGSVQDI